MIECRWSNRRGECLSIAAGLGDATPERCAKCDHYAGRPRGAGDVVHAVARATGIDRLAKAAFPDGCGCAERRAALNAALPLPDRRGGDT